MRNFRGSRSFAYALMYALHYSQHRNSRNLQVGDVLAGIYITGLEKVSKYWKDIERLEDVLYHECDMREPRWFYLIREYRDRFEAGGREPSGSVAKGQSDDLAAVLTTAAHLAASRAQSAGTDNVVACEDFLLALLRHPEIEIAAKLLGSGLDVQQLEEAVRILRPVPG